MLLLFSFFWYDRLKILKLISYYMHLDPTTILVTSCHLKLTAKDHGKQSHKSNTSTPKKQLLTHNSDDL